MMRLFSSSKRSARDMFATRPCEFVAALSLAIGGLVVPLDMAGFEPLLIFRYPFGAPPGGRDITEMSAGE
jgi:hypothetical protein